MPADGQLGPHHYTCRRLSVVMVTGSGWAIWWLAFLGYVEDSPIIDTRREEATHASRR